MRRVETGTMDAGSDAYGEALSHARARTGAWLEDPRGRRRLDLCNAGGAVLLGWRHPAVEAAAAEPEAGDAHEVASRLAALLPGAEAVSFAPSLASALAATLMAAKAQTGRDGAFFCEEAGASGRDITRTREAIQRHDGRLAAIVVRPLDASVAWLAEVRRLADLAGAMLIFEESRTAFRVHAGGAQGLSGVRADAVICGPSIANGRPLAAIAGSMDLMRALRGSRAAIDPAALAAARAVLRQLDSEDASVALRVRGAEIAAELESRLVTTGAKAWLGVWGDPCWSVVAGDPAFEADLEQALFDRGVLSFGAHVLSLAFGELEMARLLAAYDAVLPRLVERAERLERLAG